jgi:hypothetical protein
LRTIDDFGSNILLYVVYVLHRVVGSLIIDPMRGDVCYLSSCFFNT